jgi:hypothetical protein
MVNTVGHYHNKLPQPFQCNATAFVLSTSLFQSRSEKMSRRFKSSLLDHEDEGNATVGTSNLVKRISVIACLIDGFHFQCYSLLKLVSVIYIVIRTRKGSHILDVERVLQLVCNATHCLCLPYMWYAKSFADSEQILRAVSSESGAYCASTPRLSSYFGTCCQLNHSNVHADKTCIRFAKPDGKKSLWRQMRWQYDSVRMVKMKVKLYLCLIKYNAITLTCGSSNSTHS